MSTCKLPPTQFCDASLPRLAPPATRQYVCATHCIHTRLARAHFIPRARPPPLHTWPRDGGDLFLAMRAAPYMGTLLCPSARALSRRPQRACHCAAQRRENHGTPAILGTPGHNTQGADPVQSTHERPAFGFCLKGRAQNPKGRGATARQHGNPDTAARQAAQGAQPRADAATGAGRTAQSTRPRASSFRLLFKGLHTKS